MKTCLLVCLLTLAPPVSAQTRLELAPGTLLVSSLTEAVSVRVDPGGLIYIVDAGRHLVDVRAPDGAPVSVIGGPGTGGRQFDGPMDVDPTNGLLIVVADAGNGRIARFSAQRQLTESIPLYGSYLSRPGEGASVAALGGSRDLGPGRPVAVVLNESNETYAIDQSRSLVAKWDISRRLVALIGDDSGYVRLRRPVALEVVGDRLCVADAGTASIVVFDLFGGFVSEFGGGVLGEIVGLGGRLEEIWVLHSEGLSVFSSSGVREADFRLPDGVKGAVDVAATGRSLYVLTRTTLYRWALDATGRPRTLRR